MSGEDDTLASAAESDAAATAAAGVAAAEAEAEAALDRAQAAAARAAELRSRIAAATEPPAARSRPRRNIVPAVTAAALIALLTATALMLWSHRDAVGQRQQAAEYTAAARQSVINLMSIDYNTADDSVQRVLDGSTGKFRDNFAETSDDFVRALQEEKVITTATVNAAAVESMTADSAVVLVSATSRRAGAKAPQDQQQPRVWRIVLTLRHDGGQIKMSSVEFV